MKDNFINENTINNYFELREKVFERFNQNDFVSNDEYISGFDLVNAIISQMKFYSDTLIKENLNFTKRKNRLNEVKNITYGIKNNDCFAEIFVSCFRYKVNCLSDFHNYGCDIFKNNKFFEKLYLFSDDFKGFDFTFNPLNHDLRGIYHYSDDLFSFVFDLSSPENSRIFFSNPYNTRIGFFGSDRKHIDLNEYIEFYTNDILKKIAIKIDDLNPLFKEIIKKQRNLEENLCKVHKKRK